jgi:hypothetical protein
MKMDDIQLIALLERYGGHDSDCENIDDENVCSCGWWDQWMTACGKYAGDDPRRRKHDVATLPEINARIDLTDAEAAHLEELLAAPPAANPKLRALFAKEQAAVERPDGEDFPLYTTEEDKQIIREERRAAAERFIELAVKCPYYNYDKHGDHNAVRIRVRSVGALLKFLANIDQSCQHCGTPLGAFVPFAKEEP